MNSVVWMIGEPEGPKAQRIRERLIRYVRFARDLESLSTCRRRSVGCVIASDDLTSVASIGYNGQPRGTPNDGCSGEVGSCGCIHAEANALVKIPGWYSDTTMLVTCSPCAHCSGLIVNSGKVSVVLYDSTYRVSDGLYILGLAGVAVFRTPEILGSGKGDDV